ncbi:MAG TPA: hypothetical protein VF889_08525 [Bacteroidota bacterium]
MSTTDPSVEPVQPDEGQGGEATPGDSPYADYLNRIPEEVRGEVEPVFRDWDANTTKRFQEHSEFRKQWEPLKDTGVDQLTPEQAAYAVQLFQALDDPQTMKQWWDGYAEQNGLTPQEAKQAQQAVESTLEDFQGYEDPTRQLEKLLEERLTPLQQRLEQYDSRFQQQEQQAREAEAAKFIEGQVAELEQKHGKFDEQTTELVNTLAGRYIESDPMNAIPRAYEDLQRWRNDVEKAALQAKVDAPAPAESGGIPDVSPEQHTRLDSPAVKDMALEFLRNSNRA